MKFRPILVAATTLGAMAILLSIGTCSDLPSEPGVPLTPAKTEEAKAAVTGAFRASALSPRMDEHRLARWSPQELTRNTSDGYDEGHTPRQR